MAALNFNRTNKNKIFFFTKTDSYPFCHQATLSSIQFDLPVSVAGIYQGGPHWLLPCGATTPKQVKAPQKKIAALCCCQNINMT